MPFFISIRLKVNLTVRLEFELTHNNFAVQHVRRYVTATSSFLWVEEEWEVLEEH